MELLILLPKLVLLFFGDGLGQVAVLFHPTTGVGFHPLFPDLGLEALPFGMEESVDGGGAEVQEWLSHRRFQGRPAERELSMSFQRCQQLQEKGRQALSTNAIGGLPDAHPSFSGPDPILRLPLPIPLRLRYSGFQAGRREKHLQDILAIISCGRDKLIPDLFFLCAPGFRGGKSKILI